MGVTTKAVERWKDEMPTEAEMRPKDKYTIFDRKEKGYRKGIHSQFISYLLALILLESSALHELLESSTS
jgi:hypothetical protein